ncbi:MAG: dephospho-CoA kinase [Proteobacteria bacterium]|nr:dephospho-CoA kinase [Pseudomonadota bacterium]
MFCVGLTGGIGSGKTTVANFFSELGVTIIDCDQITRDLTQLGTTGLNSIIKHFGSTILTAAQELDRKKLRNIIFNNPKEKEWLEFTLHPLILAEIHKQIQSAAPPYCVVVIPLLAEKQEYFAFLNRICVVDAPESSRKIWAAKRDQSSYSEINKIMNSQYTALQRLSIADDVIHNEKDLESLKIQVQHLHRFYIDLACNYSAGG